MPNCIITMNLWFNDNAEEAANHYVSIFENSSITQVHRFPSSPIPSAVNFTLNNAPFVAINGGEGIRFTPAVSFQVECDTQEEVDYYWERLGEGGDEKKRAAGWLVDRYGVSWQISPRGLGTTMGEAGGEKAAKVAEAILGMTKIDLATLEKL
ncbi:3-demethylubiquinone-9 3-methyltransferase [Emericellopsis atlantica]|uniref:3-demethylubiquinone-9 3-methyltransferase n=1 Tax=Emericellopsis atlantica TaxID=2614577 RepID=A0A9P8CLV3_9HYPO|nr:3-demethylubiquinone-9 3-methyltransferase [Emericellopsis atlantica]KAG9251803.1 3-demethylubiquinone-9 3-methyltransferase [Emericellopsis atlantica]